MRLRALLHRAGDVDENGDAALAQPPPPVAQPDDLAGMPHGVAKHAPSVGACTAAPGPPAISAPLRHASWQCARKEPQRFTLAACCETPLGEPLGGGRLRARLAGLVAEQGLRTNR